MTKHKKSPPAVDERSQALDAISRRLVAARLSAEPLSDFPGQLPQTLVDAYAIQAASIARWPDVVAGWKIGMLSAADQDRFKSERLAGPIFRSAIQKIEPGSCTTLPIYVGGFAAVEAEFVVELGETVRPSEKDYSDDELIGLMSSLYAGVEIASSPMAAINQIGPMCVISDFGNNSGLLLGPPIPDWVARPLESMTAKVFVDGKVVGDAGASAIAGGPLQALRFLIQIFGSRGEELPEGTLISTGASTGIHDVVVSSTARVEFGSIGWFDFRFEPMMPRQ
jgi:2-keto-4-pentenoate hydratase